MEAPYDLGFMALLRDLVRSGNGNHLPGKSLQDTAEGGGFLVSASPARRSLMSACGRESSGSGSNGNLGAQGTDVLLMSGHVLGRVSNPLKRTWERGIYVGPDATARR